MLQKWFNNLNRKQLILIRIATYVGSFILIVQGFDIYGSALGLCFGVILLVTILYLEFGKIKK